jgi:HAE1 family hydrophobic/amphiphilic exporter-1
MLPLLVASGAGAVSRRILGTVVVFGMLTATLVANFITPALFVAVERLRLALKRKKETATGAQPVGAAEE